MSFDRSNLNTDCYAVIFSYQRSNDLEGYLEMDDATLEEVKAIDGYLGHEVTGDGSEHAIFISYWKDRESIDHWRKNGLHKKAKAKGKTQWYKWYHSIICKVETSNFSQRSQEEK